MKYLKLLFIFVLLAALTAGCTSLSPYTYTGAGVGGALGAGAGALIDHNNRWRGAMVGGLMGGALGGTATELGRRAASEDASQQRTNYPSTSYQSYGSGGYYQ
jgi:Glycine zipper 2TM domain